MGLSIFGISMIKTVTSKTVHRHQTMPDDDGKDDNDGQFMVFWLFTIYVK